MYFRQLAEQGLIKFPNKPRFEPETEAHGPADFTEDQLSTSSVPEGWQYGVLWKGRAFCTGVALFESCGAIIKASEQHLHVLLPDSQECRCADFLEFFQEREHSSARRALRAF